MDDKYKTKWTGTRYEDLMRPAQDREKMENHDSLPSRRRRHLMMTMKKDMHEVKCLNGVYQNTLWQSVMGSLNKNDGNTYGMDLLDYEATPVLYESGKVRLAHGLLGVSKDQTQGRRLGDGPEGSQEVTRLQGT